ncbi:MAG: methyltransferase domain-containing protein [Cocleimonas sp.]
MHPSSLENMQKCYENYVCGDFIANRNKITVLDIGGANVNGSYADIFSQDKFDYIAADIETGEGIDMVLKDPYKIPVEDGSIDILISGQAFEHVEFFWLLFEEMSRVIKDDGWLFLIAPSSGPIHRYPVDCYRFYPDAYHALAKYTGINVIEVFHDTRGPWKDLVGVFSKNNVQETAKEWRQLKDNEINRYIRATLPASTHLEHQSDEIEKTQGEAFYIETLKSLHQSLKPKNYFEIGVRVGKSLSLASCPCIAIDPAPEINIVDFQSVNFFKSTSDFFFEHHSESIPKEGIDLAFIDGMHLFEFVLRDFINIEARAHENTIVVIDDIFPNNEIQASRTRKSQVWTGDVWKIIICLQRFRPELKLTMLNTSPTGLLIISGFNKKNHTLVEQYNPIVREFKSLEIDEYTDLVINRKDAVSPNQKFHF